MLSIVVLNLTLMANFCHLSGKRTVCFSASVSPSSPGHALPGAPGCGTAPGTLSPSSAVLCTLGCSCEVRALQGPPEIPGRCFVCSHKEKNLSHSGFVAEPLKQKARAAAVTAGAEPQVSLLMAHHKQTPLPFLVWPSELHRKLFALVKDIFPHFHRYIKPFSQKQAQEQSSNRHRQCLVPVT